MKPEIEKKIPARVARAFEDIIPRPDTQSGQKVLTSIGSLVRAVWIGKIYAALPKDKTTIAEYFLDAELEQLLNEAVDECYKMVCLIAERAKDDFRRG